MPIPRIARIAFVLVACLPGALAAQDYLDARLGNAALNGQVERVQRLIAAGANVHAKIPARFHIGETPLHLAVRTNQRELVARLIAAGANVNARDDRGETPLISAVYFEHTELARELLVHHGADPNIAMNNGLTPLHVTGDRGLAELARLLIEHGARVDAPTRSGITPLMTAAKRHASIVKLLLDAGANVGATTRQGTTPLMYGAHAASPNIMRMMLDAGADLHAKRRDGRDAYDFVLAPHYIAFDVPGTIELFAQNGVDVCRHSGEEQTPPMMLWNMRHNIAALDKLLQRGCDPRAVDSNGRSIYDLSPTDEQRALLESYTRPSGEQETRQVDDLREEEVQQVVKKKEMIVEKRVEEVLVEEQGSHLNFAEHPWQTACTPAMYRYLQDGGDPNAGSPYSPPLVESVLRCPDALERVRAMVKAGARSRNGLTRLFDSAVTYDVLDEEMFALLRKTGAVPYEDDSTNALCPAIQQGRTRAVEVLLRHEVPAFCYDFAFTLIPADLYARRQAPEEQRAALLAVLPPSSEGRLEDALVAGKIEDAASILRNHPELNTSTNTVYLAFRSGDPQLFEACLERLAGATYPVQPAMLHTGTDDGAFTESLFRSGVDVQAWDFWNRHSNLITAARDRPAMTAALLRLPLDWTQEELDTALTQAVHSDEYDSAVLLVEAGASIFARAWGGQTLLYAARKNPRMHRFLRGQGLRVQNSDEALEVPLDPDPPLHKQEEQLQKRQERKP